MELPPGYTLEDLLDYSRKQKSQFNFEKHPPDIVGKVSYFKGTSDSRTTPALSGYRPAHQVNKECLTTGNHIYIDKEMVCPGESAYAYITFLSPKHYPHCLWEGKTININEGARVVGTVTVIQIYNELLKTDASHLNEE